MAFAFAGTFLAFFIVTGYAINKEFSVSDYKSSFFAADSRLGPMITKVREGIALLKASPRLVYETSNKKDSGKLIRKQIAFAVLDKSKGTVFEQKYWINQEDLEKTNKSGIITLEPVSNKDWLEVKVKWWKKKL